MVYHAGSAGASRLAVVAILGANRIYDLMPALDWESHVAQLEALAETTLLCIGRDVFFEELKNHP